MTTVLVVDDSAVDRRLVGGLLEKDAELKVRYAVDGGDALAAMKRGPVDLVLTDLVMPGMDGLQLVAAVRGSTPSVPVILMTSKGSEEIAVRALQDGAASYVPKRILAQELLDTVRRVIALSARQRSHGRLLGHMTHSLCKFELGNESALVSTLVQYLQENLLQMGLCGDAECTRIGVALEEAMVNAMYHGNLEVGSELRGEDDTSFYRVAAERARVPPYRDRRILIQANLTRDEAVFSIRDEGPGFDPSTLPDPTSPESLERVSGRGLLLMRAFMDDIRHNSTGNEVTLVKRRSPEPASSQNEVA